MFPERNAFLNGRSSNFFWQTSGSRVFLIFFKSCLLGVCELTVERLRIDPIRLRTDRLRNDSLAKRPVTAATFIPVQRLQSRFIAINKKHQNVIVCPRPEGLCLNLRCQFEPGLHLLWHTCYLKQWSFRIFQRLMRIGRPASQRIAKQIVRQQYDERRADSSGFNFIAKYNYLNVVKARQADKISFTDYQFPWCLAPATERRF